MKVEERLRRDIACQLNAKLAQIKPETLFADLGADSLDSIEICMLVEDELGIDISVEEWQSVKTFGDVMALVQRQPGNTLGVVG